MLAFIHRLRRLLGARRALFEGAPERALERLRDPALALSAPARRLRLRALELLYRAAAEKAALGRDDSLARILAFAAAEDPRRAAAWRSHLGAGPREVGPSRPAPAAREAGGFASEARLASVGGEPLGGGRPGPGPIRRLPSPSGFPLRFHLAVDEGGEFLVLSGSQVTFGHARGAADVPLLADLEARHARLLFGESFHGGASWRLEPLEGRGVRVDGRPVEESVELASGARIDLSDRVAWRFDLPDPSSASARIELLGGIEALGAPHLLLLAPGAAGRVRIASPPRRHLQIPGIEEEILLSLEPLSDPRELAIECAGGVRLTGGGDAHTRLRLPCPPDRRLDVIVGARPSQVVPFCLSIAPVLPEGRGPTMPEEFA